VLYNIYICQSSNSAEGLDGESKHRARSPHGGCRSPSPAGGGGSQVLLDLRLERLGLLRLGRDQGVVVRDGLGRCCRLSLCALVGLRRRGRSRVDPYESLPGKFRFSNADKERIRLQVALSGSTKTA
jgi:hypothetical protein